MTEYTFMMANLLERSFRFWLLAGGVSLKVLTDLSSDNTRKLRFALPLYKPFFAFILCVFLIILSLDAGVSSDDAPVEVDIPAGDVGALIAAIDLANLDNVDHIINLAPGATYIFTVKHNDVAGANALPSIRTNITINGNGAALKREAGSEPFRIFQVFFNVGELTLNDLTVTGGMADAPDPDDQNGGAIYNRGILHINNSVIKGNEAPRKGGGVFNLSIMTLTNSVINDNKVEGLGSSGGGIYNDGQLAIVDSTVSGNKAALSGGGIYSSQELKVESTTIVGNRAEGAFSGGGGIYNTGAGDATLINVTISGNENSGNPYRGGGGLLNEGNGSLTIVNSTIKDNKAIGTTNAGGGGGIFNGVAEAFIKNTIIADNTASQGGTECKGTLVSQGHNIIRDIAGSPGCAIQGDTITNITGEDPLLGELIDNLGPTRTHALLPGSPAIDRIPFKDCKKSSSATLNFDQRGTMRPLDGDKDGTPLCDIGSYELSLICGDVNGNGVVEVVDMEHGLALTVSLPVPAYVNPTLGDLDQDNKPTIFDAVIGLKHIVNGQDINDCGPT